MKPILIIRTGQAPSNIRARHGDFPHWFRLGAGIAPQHIQIVDVAAGEHLPQPQEFSGALITGSAAMVTDRAPWSERTAGWIRNAMDVDLPLLGVCYGHQLMAHALGGRIDYLPGGREIGTMPINIVPGSEQDALTFALPSQFRAHTTHEQSVMDIPKGAKVLARSERDPHQLIRYSRNAISTQFHPEFNADVMRAYIKRKHHDMRREGFDPHHAFRQVAATPVARRLLKMFSKHHGLSRGPR